MCVFSTVVRVLWWQWEWGGAYVRWDGRREDSVQESTRQILHGDKQVMEKTKAKQAKENQKSVTNCFCSLTIRQSSWWGVEHLDSWRKSRKMAYVLVHKATITIKKWAPTWNHLACRREANATRHLCLSNRSAGSLDSTLSIGEKNGTGNQITRA